MLQTRILVTHGLTYLPQVDKIIVLKNGAISEEGTYKELMEKKGQFQEFLLQYLSEASEQEDDISECDVLFVFMFCSCNLIIIMTLNELKKLFFNFVSSGLVCVDLYS